MSEKDTTFNSTKRQDRVLPEDSLGDWRWREALAELMVPIIGSLYRDGVHVLMYGQSLVNESPVSIMQAHRFIRQVEGNELSEQETYPILQALGKLNLADCEIDLGELTVNYPNFDKLPDDISGIDSYLEQELASVINLKASRPEIPQDIVLYGFGRVGRLVARMLVESTGPGNYFRLKGIVIRKASDDDIYKRAKLLRSWGRSSSIFDEKSEAIENRFNVKIEDIDYDAKFIFEEIGYNLEGSEIGAAFGLVQLKKLEENIQERIKNFNTQTKFFESLDEYFITPKETKEAYTAWLAYPIIIKDSAPFTRRDFQIYLEKNNIQTRTVFTGNITRQPGFKNIKMRKLEELPNSDKIMKDAVLLACHHGLTKDMINHMHNTIKEFINKNK